MRLTRVIVPLMVFAASALAQDVRYNFDKNADFTKYRTYKWVAIKGSSPLNQLAEQQVEATIETALAKEGLVKATGDQADLLIGYQVTINQEKEFSSYSSDFGYGPGWGRGWYGYGGMGGSTMTTGQTSTIHIGDVALDMYDPATKQLVWRGDVSKTLNMNAKPEKRLKNLQKGLDKLLKNYPPPRKS